MLSLEVRTLEMKLFGVRGAGYPKRDFGRRHDIIFRYSKNKDYIFNIDEVREKYAESTIERFRHHIGNIRGGRDYGDQKLNPLGRQPDDWWQIQPIAPSSKKRLGYPTQKPETLLERIIKASSNEGDIVLDPFCGCGTTIAVAERLKRNWIGIDITHLAISLIKHRIKDTFGDDVEYEVIGEPVSISGAEQLAQQDRYQFQWWALGLVCARPADNEKKKGKDKGIDGYIYFHDDNSGKTKKIIIQVKSGHIAPSQIRDLKGVVQRENAEIGVFITLRNPTKGMIEETISSGYYYSPGWNKNYPKIQILTIKELLTGKEIAYPPGLNITFKNAKRYNSNGEGSQNTLDME